MQPLQWRTILVPHDFSASANHAAAIARDEAKHRDARLVLLHVVELPQFGADAAIVLPGRSEPPMGMRDYAMSSAEAHLNDIAERLAKDGVKVDTVVRVGSPVDEINKIAAERRADLIIMGTHGRTGIRRLVAGSVTEKVVRVSHVPVLTIRHTE